MGKSLSRLARQLRTSHGYALLTTFDGGYVPGTVVSAHRWNNIDRIGALKDGLEKELIPPVEGPVICALENFNRTHEMNVGGALAYIRPAGGASGTFKQSKSVVAAFDSPQIHSMSLLELTDAIRESDEIWETTLGDALLERKTRVVYAVVRAKLSFTFLGAGAVGVDMKGAVGGLSNVELGSGWKWRNEATLETKAELPVAIETARWVKGKRRLVPMGRRV